MMMTLVVAAAELIDMAKVEGQELNATAKHVAGTWVAAVLIIAALAMISFKKSRRTYLD